jgi:putative ABC transport system permease protein
MVLPLWIDRMGQDFAYALRGLRRSPGFTAAVVLTLGLGIGVNAATFSLIDHVFLEPPAGVSHPEAIRRLYLEVENGPSGKIALAAVRYPQYRALRAATGSSIELGLFTGADSTAVVDGGARLSAHVSHVSREFFNVLGVRAAAGRLFGMDEDAIETPAPVAVISDGFWRRQYGGDASIIGRRVTIDRQTFTIVGIGPRDFTGINLDAVDVWLPLNTYAPGGGNGGPWYQTFGASISVVVRPADAAREARLLAAGTAAIRTVNMAGFAYDPNMRLLSGPIIEALGPMQQRNELVVAARIAAVALMVLIIACANVTNLLLLRATRRRQEIAVRRALGVSRGRLAEQLTTESLLLALLGGAVAVVLALWAAAALRQLVLPRVHWASGPIDLDTVMVVAGLSTTVGVVGGLAPAFQAMRPDLVESLKAGMRDGAYRKSRLRSTLLALQAALCVVLLVGAGLFTRSVHNVRSIGVGYETADRMFVRPQFDDPRAHDDELAALLPQAAERLRTIDGVLEVAFTAVVPLQGSAFRMVYLPGQDTVPQLPGDYGPSIVPVSRDFFRASGLRITTGRELNDEDMAGTSPAIVVGESMARLYWPGESPIGKCLMIMKRDGPCFRVVGVAADAHRRGIIERPIAQFYVPMTASYARITRLPSVPRGLIVHTRTSRGAAVTRATEQILRSLGLPILGVRSQTFESVLEPELRPWRLGATLFTALGALALVVATIGVYSVVAYGVSQRTHEMGVRIALGAQRRDILDLILGDGLRVVAIGIGAGILASLLLGRYVASLLFGVVPQDPSALIVAVCLLSSAAAAACLVPGWRASRADPVASLRAE